MRTSLLLLALIVALPLVAAEKTKDVPTKVADAPTPEDPPLPEKVQPPDEPPPTVSIRNVKGAVIEEYRQGGRLYMVRVVPERGPAYTYLDTDGNGRLEYDGEDGPVRPVYYTLYEWD
ncbi:MAG: DUF2782 domain-containing protein [Rhodanobacteraceae bacterium]|jgi:hypothetical protein|nr:DUF2782 domain-containing protein [Rhodanobacteraceae bacterium]MBL0039741.1 DUF2782 domain-containing protein [Xanthomonadales bacterium]MBP6078550.1 DUF2782 domain-containing protein [Xanthomonadales bacterium]